MTEPNDVSAPVWVRTLAVVGAELSTIVACSRVIVPDWRAATPPPIEDAVLPVTVELRIVSALSGVLVNTPPPFEPTVVLSETVDRSSSTCTPLPLVATSIPPPASCDVFPSTVVSTNVYDEPAPTASNPPPPKPSAVLSEIELAVNDAVGTSSRVTPPPPASATLSSIVVPVTVSDPPSAMAMPPPDPPTRMSFGLAMLPST